MIDYIKYRFDLRKLKRKQKENWKFYRPFIEESKREGKETDETKTLYGEARALHDEIQYEIDSLVKWYLLNTADKLMVPTPEITAAGGMWEERIGGYFLTSQGIAHLKSAIRQDRKQKYDLLIPWISAITGLIGAIIGLLGLLVAVSK